MRRTATGKSRNQDSRTIKAKTQRHSRLEYEREQEGFARFKCNWLKLWSVCRSKACHRHKACSGNARTCWDEKWAAAPERLKLRLQLFIIALKHGLPATEAVRYSNEKMVRLNAKEAASQRAAAAEAITPPAPALTPAPTPEPRGPRIRWL